MHPLVYTCVHFPLESIWSNQLGCTSWVDKKQHRLRSKIDRLLKSNKYEMCLDKSSFCEICASFRNIHYLPFMVLSKHPGWVKWRKEGRLEDQSSSYNA